MKPNNMSYRGPINQKPRPEAWPEFLLRIANSTPEQMREWWATLKGYEKAQVRECVNRAFSLVYLISQLDIPDLIMEKEQSNDPA